MMIVHDADCMTVRYIVNVKVSQNGFVSEAVGLRFKSRAGQIDTELPTARLRCNISSKVTVLPGRNDTKMGPANSLYALA